MPDPDEAEDERLLLSMLTQRPDEPVAETTELQRGRAAKAAAMMGSPYWNGQPMYFEPAASFDFTDQLDRDMYLERLAHDAEHRAAKRPDDMFFREAWEEGKQEEDSHMDWALRPGTPPWWPSAK